MKYHKNISKETLGDYFGDESHFNIAVRLAVIVSS